jgi:hypothetical protein
MKKVHLLLFGAIIFIVSCSTFVSQQQVTYTPVIAAEVVEAPFGHEPVTSEKAQEMMRFFVNNARKADHHFTKFNRQELIEILQSMPEDMDTVKFIMGAFMEDGPGMKKGKPVIMLQAPDQSREQPGGLAVKFVYYKGAICPPPEGTCGLE